METHGSRGGRSKKDEVIAVLYDRSYVGSQNDLEETTMLLRPPQAPVLCHVYSQIGF